MMMRDHLDDIVRQFPLFRHRPPGLAMGESHGDSFRLVQRNLPSEGTFHRRGKFPRKNQAVHHESYVVHQSRHIGLFMIRSPNFSLNFWHTMAHSSECLQNTAGSSTHFLRRESLPPYSRSEK
jgi:hypothetical protein